MELCGCGLFAKIEAECKHAFSRANNRQHRRSVEQQRPRWPDQTAAEVPTGWLLRAGRPQCFDLFFLGLFGVQCSIGCWVCQSRQSPSNGMPWHGLCGSRSWSALRGSPRHAKPGRDSEWELHPTAPECRALIGFSPHQHHAGLTANITVASIICPPERRQVARRLRDSGFSIC